jgi:hypothetical protein
VARGGVTRGGEAGGRELSGNREQRGREEIGAGSCAIMEEVVGVLWLPALARLLDHCMGSPSGRVTVNFFREREIEEGGFGDGVGRWLPPLPWVAFVGRLGRSCST